MRGWIGQLALVLFGLSAALLLTEGLLQAGALIAGSTRGTVLGLSTRSNVVLCLGDSNTYGFGVEPTESYPARLQELLGDEADVINLGFPGMNSSRVRRDFRRMIEVSRPQLVLLMIGVNDSWTAPVEVDEGDDSRSSLRSLMWKYSRTYRLLFMLERALWRQKPKVVSQVGSLGAKRESRIVRYAGQRFTLGFEAEGSGLLQGWELIYRRNMAAIQRIADAEGVRLVVLTYPSSGWNYAAATEVVRQVARELGLPLIDLGESFTARCKPDCRELFFRDGHPTAEGYRQVAALVASQAGPWLEEPSSSRNPRESEAAVRRTTSRGAPLDAALTDGSTAE